MRIDIVPATVYRDRENADKTAATLTVGEGEGAWRYEVVERCGGFMIEVSDGDGIIGYF